MRRGINTNMSQVESLYALLSDYEPHSTREIQKSVYGADHLGRANIPARILDIKRKYRVQIESWPDAKQKTIWYYRMIRPEPKQSVLFTQQNNPYAYQNN